MGPKLGVFWVEWQKLDRRHGSSGAFSRPHEGPKTGFTERQVEIFSN